MGISSIIFIILLGATAFLFSKNVAQIIKNIRLGLPLNRNDNSSERWKTMFKIAIGQSKMVKRPIAGALHIVVYVGFIIINIEVLEIIIDGIMGTHRIFSFTGSLYYALIASFEFLALGVWTACLIFLIRRNVLKIKRFHKPEMKGWAFNDANIILITEVLLMSAFLVMNSVDSVLQTMGSEHYVQVGTFPVSGVLMSIFTGMSESTLIFIERGCWWFHIVGIFAFLNYLPYSKHFHILLAFPNVFFSNLNPKGKFTNMEAVKKEVELMFDPEADPYAAPPENAEPVKFGAKDVQDLTWKQLMDSYTCTECGRCTSNCPANLTGKLLSPRKIMMDTRDRLEEVGKNIKTNGEFKDDNKSLLRDYISPEEIWACTSCNACTEACPVNIDPLSIIVDLRRHLVMEESAAPTELNGMSTNIENNGAPWQFAQADRLNWASEE